jgi:hypothetical protein
VAAGAGRLLSAQAGQGVPPNAAAITPQLASIRLRRAADGTVPQFSLADSLDSGAAIVAALQANHKRTAGMYNDGPEMALDSL